MLVLQELRQLTRHRLFAGTCLRLGNKDHSPFEVNVLAPDTENLGPAHRGPKPDHVVGLSRLIAGVPWAAVLAFIVLVLGIAQVPALIVTFPAIIYIWWSGDYGNVAAIAYTVLLPLTGMIDNVLKPLMLGRGVDSPMSAILLGVLGDMAVAAILGMFIGATLFALGYQIFMGWVADDPDEGAPRQDGDTQPAQ